MNFPDQKKGTVKNKGTAHITGVEMRNNTTMFSDISLNTKSKQAITTHIQGEFDFYNPKHERKYFYQMLI